MLEIIAILILILYTILGYKKPGIALVTSPAVSGVLFYISVQEASLTAQAIAVTTFFATLVAVVLSGHEADFEGWPQVWAKWILRISAFLLLLVTAGIVFGPLGIFGLIFFVILIGSVISYGLTARLATAAYVISTIGSSMRQNLPLPMALESAAVGRRDRQAKILQRIKKWLVQGYSLSESIRRSYPKCPGYAVALIAAAERIDQVPLAMKALEADMLVRADERRKFRPVHPFYPVVIIIFVFFMVWAVATFVLPKFEQVLTEMFEGAQLPKSTQILMKITGLIAYEYGWLIGLIGLFLILIIIPVCIRLKFRPRRPERPYLVSRIGDFVRWHLPILHWFERNYSMVQVVELLRLSLNAGCTVNEAIANTLGLDVNNHFKKSIARWLTRVERGDNIATAARESKLSNSLAWAFDDKVNRGNTLSILEMLESFYRSNYSYRVNLARFIMWPCVIILMGLVVGFVVYAIFSPSVAILHHFATSVTP
ncbi:MAG: type II secretion system F family protein [Planctomycetota bacterium]|jgi:type IV pilus assembly protein PilC